MVLKSYIGIKIWPDSNCVMPHVCEQEQGPEGQREPDREKERERERACTVKMLFKITIELGLKNRNPLFPELETIAVCHVGIRCVCRCVREKKRATKSASQCPGYRDFAGGRARTDTYHLSKESLAKTSQNLLRSVKNQFKIS